MTAEVGLMQGFYSWFWNEKLWLPANVTWKDLNAVEDGVFIPSVTDLWAVLPFSLALCAVRFLWTHFVAEPIGRWFNLKSSGPRRPERNAVLEKAYDENGKPDYKMIVQLSKKIDWTPRQVERWFRRRRIAGYPSEVSRFSETSWRGLYYLGIFCYGLYILWDKPWFRDTKQCYVGHPRQHVSGEVWFYYMVSIGFYISLILQAMWDVKRKDFVVHMVHHGVTVALLAMSWTLNMVRIGSLVLCLHDFADYWLEGAKLAKYVKSHLLAVVLYNVFTVVWLVTRLGVYPYKLIRSSLFEAFSTYCPMFYISNTMLILLLVIHVIWTYFILETFFAFIFRGKEEKDGRSGTEVSSSSEEEVNHPNNNTPTAAVCNGTTVMDVNK